MFTNIIENRGKEFTGLLKIGDYLARTLRENVELFFVEGGEVTYLTESGSVITGKYSLKPTLKLTNIIVEDSEVLEDKQAFEKVAEEKVSNLLGDLLEGDYSEADGTFDEILGLYETKLSFDRIKERLIEKTQRFGEQTNITETGPFKRVLELKPKLVEFLRENKNFLNVPEIKNGMKLALVVSNSFNLPKRSISEIQNAKTFEVPAKSDNTIYEHLCRQELVAKELLESKKNFDSIWASNQGIEDLIALVYEQNENKVYEQVAKVISDIPYFALATKKQLSTLIKNSILYEDIKVSNKDVTDFVKRIYEMKKPVKAHIVSLLNEKYGININNLTDTPTFSNLLKTETVILTSLGKLAPKNSLIKKSLFELAESLKLKNGAESIDLANFLNEVFDEAGYADSINETNLMSYLDFNRVADDLGKIGQVLKMIMPVVTGQNPQAGAAPMASENPMTAAMGAGGEGPAAEGPNMKDLMGADDPLGSADPMDSSGEAGLDMEGSPSDSPDPQDIANDINMEDEAAAMEGEEDVLGGEEDVLGGEEGEEEMLPGMEDEEEDIEAEEQVGSEELLDLMSGIEDVLADLKAELGDPDIDDEGSEFDPEEEFEDEFGGEEDEEEFSDDEESDEEFGDDEEFEDEEEFEEEEE